MADILNKEQYSSRVKELNDAAKLYYQGKDSGMTDEEFDQAVEDLRKYEDITGIVDPNSPTQKVNEGSEEDKIEHDAPMLSLRDIFNQGALEGWVISKPRQFWCVEEKIDGLSIELVYRGGKFLRAVTRGNGYKGVECSAVIKEIPGVPNDINYYSDLTVRVEVYMPFMQFEKYKVDTGTSPKNPRNLAVGLVKRINDTSGAAYLSYWAFNIQKLESTNANDLKMLSRFTMSTHHGQLRFLKELGFFTVPSKVCDPDQVWEEIEEIRKRRPNLPYNIDGAVIKADDMGVRKSMGDDGAVPRWAVAYKYPPKEAKTELLSISYQLGKSGKLTPVANLAPVDLDGSTVSRATLHNKNRMEELDVRVGDLVTLYKAGDIIPAIKSAEHTASSKPFEYPTHCPVCGEPLDGETCVNVGCSQKDEARLQYWASRSGLDMRGISAATVQALIDAGKIHTVVDFYSLTPADLKLIPKFGAIKIKKTLSAIEASKESDFTQVLAALCIDGLGFSSAFKLTGNFPTWEALENATVEQFQALLGGSAGYKIYTTLHTEYYMNLIQKLKEIFPF